MEKFKTVDEFMTSLNNEKLHQVELLRRIILDAEPGLIEHIKWNAPSYVLDGEDRLTFNILNKQGVVKLILHMGATKKEDKKAKPVLDDVFGIIEWNSDIRGMISFQDVTDIKLQKQHVSQLIKEWLTIKP